MKSSRTCRRVRMLYRVSWRVSLVLVLGLLEKDRKVVQVGLMCRQREWTLLRTTFQC